MLVSVSVSLLLHCCLIDDTVVIIVLANAYLLSCLFSVMARFLTILFLSFVFSAFLICIYLMLPRCWSKAIHFIYICVCVCFTTFAPSSFCYCHFFIIETAFIVERGFRNVIIIVVILFIKQLVITYDKKSDYFTCKIWYRKDIFLKQTTIVSYRRIWTEKVKPRWDLNSSWSIFICLEL